MGEVGGLGVRLAWVPTWANYIIASYLTGLRVCSYLSNGVPRATLWAAGTKSWGAGWPRCLVSAQERQSSYSQAHITPRRRGMGVRTVF